MSAQVIELFKMLFNEHPASICLLSTDGEILAVNEAWRQFGTANGLKSSYRFEGQNYLDLCAAAAEHGDVYAQQTLVGLLDVLATGRTKFVLSYPCHSPSERRWFKLWIEPQMPSVHAVVVAHQLERAERVMGLDDEQPFTGIGV